MRPVPQTEPVPERGLTWVGLPFTAGVSPSAPCARATIAGGLLPSSQGAPVAMAEVTQSLHECASTVIWVCARCP